jgi:hypothetical protein
MFMPVVPAYGILIATVHGHFHRGPVTQNGTVRENCRPDMKEASRTVSRMPSYPVGLCGLPQTVRLRWRLNPRSTI